MANDTWFRLSGARRTRELAERANEQTTTLERQKNIEYAANATTDKTQAITQAMRNLPKTRGIATCNYLNWFLHNSGGKIIIPTHEGLLLVSEVHQLSDDWLTVRGMNSNNREITVVVPWHVKFDLYMGMP